MNLKYTFRYPLTMLCIWGLLMVVVAIAHDNYTFAWKLASWAAFGALWDFLLYRKSPLKPAAFVLFTGAENVRHPIHAEAFITKYKMVGRVMIDGPWWHIQQEADILRQKLQLIEPPELEWRWHLGWPLWHWHATYHFQPTLLHEVQP